MVINTKYHCQYFLSVNNIEPYKVLLTSELAIKRLQWLLEYDHKMN
jgi:hypothetical protein